MFQDYLSVSCDYVLMFLFLKERFACYHLLLASNNTFMTYFKYLGTTQIWWNLNEHHCYLTSTNSVVFQIDATCSPFQVLNMLPLQFRLEPLRLIYCSLTRNFSEYHFKTDALCLFFFPSHVFSAFDFDSSYIGILLWKIVKPHDDVEIKPLVGEIFQDYKLIIHYFLMSQK